MEEPRSAPEGRWAGKMLLGEVAAELTVQQGCQKLWELTSKPQVAGHGQEACCVSSSLVAEVHPEQPKTARNTPLSRST